LLVLKYKFRTLY